MDVDDEEPLVQSVDKDLDVKDKMEPESSTSEVVTDQMDIRTETLEKDKTADTPGDINDTLNDDANTSPMNEELEKLNKAEEICMETNEAVTDKGDTDTDNETGGEYKRDEGYGTDKEKGIFDADKGEGEVETERRVDISLTTDVGCKNPEEEIIETEKEVINSSNKSETSEISSISNEEVTFSVDNVAVASEQDSFLKGDGSKDGDTNNKISTPQKTPDSSHDDSGFSDVEPSDVSTVSVSSDLSPFKQNDFEKSTTEL